MDSRDPPKNIRPCTAERALVALAHILRGEVRSVTSRQDLQEDLMQEMAWAILMKGDGRQLEHYLAAARRRMWKVLKAEERAGRAI